MIIWHILYRILLTRELSRTITKAAYLSQPGTVLGVAPCGGSWPRQRKDDNRRDVFEETGQQGGHFVQYEWRLSVVANGGVKH